MNARSSSQGRPETRAVDDAVWCGLCQTHLMVTRGLDSELRAAHRLPLGEFELLRALAQPGCAQRMTGLAGAVGLSPSGLTRAIERLEARGLVHRVPCADDRRGAMAELTEAGRALLAEASVTHGAALRHLLLDHLSPADSAQLMRLWQRLGGQETTGCAVAGELDRASHRRAQVGRTLTHSEPAGDD